MALFFDNDKKLKFFIQVEKDEQLYTFFYLGALMADIEQLKKTGQDATKLTGRLKYLKGRKKLLQKEVTDWLLSNNIEQINGPKSVEDLVVIADKLLRTYRVRVYTRAPPERVYRLLYDMNKEAQKVINLAIFESSFNTFVPCFSTINQSVCKLCLEPYKILPRHKCKAVCVKCAQHNCDAIENTVDYRSSIHCPECNFVFKTEKCFAGHLQPKLTAVKRRGGKAKSKCGSVKCCIQCQQVYSTESKEAHDCAKSKYCKICHKKVNPDFHDCCWPGLSETTKRKDIEKQSHYKLTFFDFECIIVNEQDEHIQQYPNLVCYTSLCEQCRDLDPYTDVCQKCGTSRSGHFAHSIGDSRESVVDKFIDLLLFDQRFNNSIVMAHYGSRYDHIFILERFLQRGITPKIITRGSTIIIMEVDGIPGVRNHVTFKDTWMFLPIPLSLMPTLYDLEGQMKGTFPFYFNKESNYNVSQNHLPDKKYYAPQYMTVEARRKFDEWYDENYNTYWSFKEQLLSYCRNDCYILHLAIAKFIKMCLSLYNLHPILHAATLPSYVFKILKSNHIKSDTIQIIPELGYRKDNQSLIAIQYIQWVEYTTSQRFRYCLSGGEYPITINGRMYKVDAIEVDSHKILEVLGCIFHACPKHYNHNHPSPFKKGKSMGDVFNETFHRINEIKKEGYLVDVIWECEIREMLSKSKEMRDFFNSREYLKPMTIRAGYFGGRTQCTKLRCTANLSKGESIQNLDVRSLYPSEMIRNEFPEGSCVVKTDYSGEIHLPLPFKGFCYCAILAPRNLLHPIIPYRRKADKKLVFCLCRSCAENFNNNSCTHESIDQRVIYTVVYHAELTLAMQNGYRCLHIYESYHWSRWGNIFKDFLLPLQKIKTEASGWPSDDMTEEEKDAYIKLVYDNEGIKLDKNNMKLNKAMRQLSKTMSNASYGKLAQRVDRSSVEFLQIDSPKIYEFFLDEFITIVSQRIVGKFLMVTYKQDGELLECSPYTSVAYAAIITSHARMTLWHALNELGDAICYYDTDSVYAFAKPGQVILESQRGDFLGKFSVDHDSNYIIYDFVSIASKVYSYKMAHKQSGEVKEVVKAKGVTINSSTANLVTFDSLARLADAFIQNNTVEHITTGGPQIIKTRDATITTKETSKKLKVVMDKLRYLPNYDTRPFGYCDN